MKAMLLDNRYKNEYPEEDHFNPGKMVDVVFWLEADSEDFPNLYYVRVEGLDGDGEEDEDWGADGTGYYLHSHELCVIPDDRVLH